MEDGKDDKTRMTPPDGGGAPQASRDDDATRVMSAQDNAIEHDDATRLMNPAGPAGAQQSMFPEDEDDDATRVMPSADIGGSSDGDDDATRVMAADDADDDATRVMDVTLDADDDATRVMDAAADADDDATRVLGGAAEVHDATTHLKGNDPLDESTRVLGEEALTESTQVDTRPDAGGPSVADISAELDAGKTIIKDRFVLEEMLGAGGMGSVYKAKDLRKVEARDRNPWVAVKLLNEDFKTHPLAFISLQREARKSQTLAHPNIVQVFDFDREGDMVYMTMELLQGNDLNHFIRENPEGVELDEALRLTREMGAALNHAHANNITHADFKPANVFMGESGTAKVLDFGIAQAIAHADVGPSTDDKTAFDPSSLGALTPAYASLEMLQGKDPLPADDIYALGCIAYQLLCGKHPYDKMPADEAVTKGKRPEKIDRISRKQWRALQKAIALKREERFETVEEFLDEFAPLANPWARRLGIAVGIALVLGGVGVYQAVSNYYAEQDRTAEVRAREAQIAAEASRMESLQQVRDGLDRSFAGFQAGVERVKGDLSQHRFAFEASPAWKQRMGGLIAQLRELLASDDWRAGLTSASELDAATRETLQQEEQQRREAAGQSAEEWIGGYKEKVAKDYLQLASTLAANTQFADATAAIGEARALDPDSPTLLQTNRELESLVAENRRENQAIAAAAREAAREQARIQLETDFQADDAAIREDLKSCTSTLSRTGRGGSFTYDIGALAARTAALGTRYAALGETLNTAQTAYVGELGACIQLYGYADPAAAKQQLKIAQKKFPSYAGQLSSLSIYPWDTCKASFAGKGQRYDCQDRFLGKSEKGPILVVIPAGSDLPGFAIGKYEISEGEFNTWCKQSGACEASAADAALPVTGRTPEQVAGYIDWLSESTGFAYQLPTRDQWLYAADAAGTGLDSGRNCTLASRGIMKGQVMLPIEIGADNGWGLIHHVGNARELVSDAGGYVAVGGARIDPMDDCTVQAVAPAAAGGDSFTGFRVVRTRP